MFFVTITLGTYEWRYANKMCGDHPIDSTGREGCGVWSKGRRHGRVVYTWVGPVYIYSDKIQFFEILFSFWLSMSFLCSFCIL